MGCPLAVHYWEDLLSGHRLRCYGNITRSRNVSEYMLVLAICIVICLQHVRRDAARCAGLSATAGPCQYRKKHVWGCVAGCDDCDR